MNDKETIEAIEGAVTKALAEPVEGISLDAAVAGLLNAQGWIVKSCTVVTWQDGSHTVNVSNDGRNITHHMKG